MAKISLCAPFQLFNLLNQCSSVSRLAEINYLCLIDARETDDYRMSHIPTAINAKMDSKGTFLLPEDVEVDSMQQVVVYDSNTSVLQGRGRVFKCAQELAKASLSPVLIVKGGFQRFSALYPFLRTEKILYTITELENLKTYPVAILAALLYMGDEKQGMDPSILKDLKVSVVISISESNNVESIRGNTTVTNFPVADSVESDLYSSLERICSVIGRHMVTGSCVLMVSRNGRSRCSAVAIAFLMHHLKYTLEEAWKYVLKCKPNVRPNTGFLQQLSDWELHVIGTKETDIYGPHF
ncbi:serine/threonine/tyrosine-interacting-like protein 1 [Gasterosteus aculeatus]|uniref:Serine/threonine/tyrosine interacting-like 1 n=1 Tax=Gasterosteus aculeatus aculeatus TaxID=481459 RepID=A0AAQ4QP27_GASAC|nr:serine/threonine/tyrosine-interacting-like protein 1 [Gasterosteus aculeatus aculeatus]